MASKKSTNDLEGTKIKAVPRPEKEIGIDTDKEFQSTIIDAVQSNSLDISAIESFNNVAQTREQVYQLIDTMAQDGLISAVLETYTEDTTETNDKGQVVWCESSNTEVLTYVSYLLDSLNIDKQIYKWAYYLITYGDCYVRLYRESDVKKENGDLFKGEQIDKNRTSLNEEVKMSVHSKDDHYVNYVELMPNSAEIFELTRFGKTQGYIQASVSSQQTYNEITPATSYLKYKLKEKDTKVYDATDFVHACLDANNAHRVPETVDIYVNDKDYESENEVKSYSYNVRSGQSILYNSFQIWRELNLLENSVLLSRLTKSSIVRILQVDVGDMPKEQVRGYMERLKQMIEQKTAINTGSSMQEYANPGPVENILYVPTHNGQGTITASTLGGDVDVKSLADLSYFEDKLFGSLKVPKQYFGLTEDSTGFNGGTSLTLISSRYAKTIKRIQNTLIQMITDLVNLFLYDRGLLNYINKFKIRMQEPTTQEENDRRTQLDAKIKYVGDIMQQLQDIESPTTKLKILKALLSNVVNDSEVLNLIQEEIDKLEKQEEEQVDQSEPTQESLDFNNEVDERPRPSFNFNGNREEPNFEEENDFETSEEPNFQETNNVENNEEDSYIPSPNEINFDALNNRTSGEQGEE